MEGIKEVTTTVSVGTGPEKALGEPVKIKKKKRKKDITEAVVFGDLDLDDEVIDKKSNKKGYVVRFSPELVYIEWEDGIIKGYPSGTNLSAENIEYMPPKYERRGWIQYYYYDLNYMKQRKELAMDVNIKFFERKAMLCVNNDVLLEAEVQLPVKGISVDDYINYRLFKDINPVPLDLGAEQQPRLYWAPGFNEPTPDTHLFNRGIFRFSTKIDAYVVTQPPVKEDDMIALYREDVEKILYLHKFTDDEVKEIIEYVTQNPSKILRINCVGKSLYLMYDCSKKNMYRYYETDKPEVRFFLNALFKVLPQEWFLEDLKDYAQKSKTSLFDSILGVYYLYKTNQIIIQERKDKKKKYKVLAKTFPFKVRGPMIGTHFQSIDIPNTTPIAPSAALKITPPSSRTFSYFGR